MALKGTNQEQGRPYNRRIVLEAIRQHGPIARGDIAAAVGLTVQTVSTITRELELEGYVVGARTGPRRRGYPAMSLAINPEGAHAIGVHVSPMVLEIAVTNLLGEIVEVHREAAGNADPQMSLARICALIRRMSATDRRRILGIGVAIPGPIDAEALSFVGTTTLSGWKGIDIPGRLTAELGLPAFVDTDHAAAALGERLFGIGRSLRSFFYLYFGVGLAGLMVENGTVMRGARRNAGEIGHLPLVSGGTPCFCGNHGCLERYLSLEALERRAAQIGRDGWIAETAPILRTAILGIENIFDPETIVIGGMAERALLSRLIAAAEPFGNSVTVRRDRQLPRLMISESGPDAVLTGAAALAVAGILSPRLGVQFAAEDMSAPADPMFKRGDAA